MGDHMFKDIERSGVYTLPASRWSATESAAQKAGLCLLNATIPPHADKDKALAHLGAELGFPTWYGANFDALFDCLTAPDWRPAPGHVIRIKGVAGLRTANPADFATLVEVLKAAAEARKGDGHPFWILLDSPARGIAALPEA
jgi:RNAse (barnase) inhibitor barstar